MGNENVNFAAARARVGALTSKISLRASGGLGNRPNPTWVGELPLQSRRARGLMSSFATAKAGKRSLTYVLTILCLTCLNGCGKVDTSSWIEAPLLMDGYTDSSNNWHGHDGELHVDSASSAYMKFSLATLPDAQTPLLVEDTNGVASTQPSGGYDLTVSVVASARIVLFAD